MSWAGPLEQGRSRRRCEQGRPRFAGQPRHGERSPPPTIPSTGFSVRPKTPRPWLLPSRPQVAPKASARPLGLRAQTCRFIPHGETPSAWAGVNISPGANCQYQGGLQPLVPRRGATDVQRPLQGCEAGDCPSRAWGVSFGLEECRSTLHTFHPQDVARVVSFQRCP